MAQFAASSMVGRTGYYLSTTPPSSVAPCYINRGHVTTWTNGTGANQANKFYEEQFSLIGNGVSTTRDFSGALIDLFGGSFVLTKLRYLYVYNSASTAGERLTVAGNLFAAWGSNGDFENVGPGGEMLRSSPVDGYTVTNSTQDTLSFTNNGTGTITVFLTAWGS